MKNELLLNRPIWALDTEYWALPGERQLPTALVAMEMIWNGNSLSYTGQSIKLGKGDFPPISPFPSTALFVGYALSADFKTFLSLGWNVRNIQCIDLYVEYRILTNGFKDADGGDLPAGLLDACQRFAVPSISSAEKDHGRELSRKIALESYTPEELQELISYCESDVKETAELFIAMLPHFSVPLAMIHGRYMPSYAQIENNGIPLDGPLFETIIEHMSEIRKPLIQKMNEKVPLYTGDSFDIDLFIEFLKTNNLSWPLTPKRKQPSVTQDTFKEMLYAHPLIPLIRDTKDFTTKTHKISYVKGSDNRNRSYIWPFSTVTGRHKFYGTYIFNGPSWWRAMIKPPPGTALAYIDWRSQEIAIAAVLSKDIAMQEAYVKGDFYMEFAKSAGAIPMSGKRKDYPREREIYKTAALALNYGQGPYNLAPRLGVSLAKAKDIIQTHKKLYPTYHDWLLNLINHAVDVRVLSTRFGFSMHVVPVRSKKFPDKPPKININSIKNWPMQSNGAEMLRIACTYCVDDRIQVIAPVHDALLVEAPIEEFEEIITKTRQHMERASKDVLGGFKVDTKPEKFVYPQRYMDTKSKNTWEIVKSILAENSWWKETI